MKPIIVGGDAEANHSSAEKKKISLSLSWILVAWVLAVPIILIL